MECLEWAYEFMHEVTLTVLGYTFSLWQLFLYTAIASLVVWFVYKAFIE